MRELARSTATGLVGCTQITEIKYTPGVVLVGALPPGFELSTVYSAAVVPRRASATLRALRPQLSAPATRALREAPASNDESREQRPAPAAVRARRGPW